MNDISNNISNQPLQRRSLEELNMMDSFLFDEATEKSEDAELIAKVIIERVIGKKINKLIVESQKQLRGINPKHKGIRMDLFATEEEIMNGLMRLNLYDIEPNKYYDDLPKRNRYYLSMLDSKLVPTKNSYNTLPNLTSIWLLPYDPFGDNQMIYHVKNMIAENDKLVYNDGINRIFLYTKGKKGGSKELRELLKYFETTISENATDNELKKIQNIVTRIKSSSDVKERYMTLEEIIYYEKRDTREAALKEGLSMGISQGISQTMQGTIAVLKSIDTMTREKAREILISNYSLSTEEAKNYLNMYW